MTGFDLVSSTPGLLSRSQSILGDPGEQRMGEKYWMLKMAFKMYLILANLFSYS